MTTDDEGRIRGSHFSHNKIRYMHLDFMQRSPLNRRKVSSAKLYRDILKLLFNKIFKEIVTGGYEFQYRKLGKFLCIKFLPKVKELKCGKIITNKPINYPATFKARNESGNRKLYVYFDNNETGGYAYKVLWDVTRSHFTNKFAYKLKLQKELKKWFHKQILSGEVQARLVEVNI